MDPNNQQQLSDSTPQDVLAEARKNLQVLIDSGLSKDLLHQWVDEGQSLQLALPLASQAFLSQQQQLLHHQLQQQSQLPQDPQQQHQPHHQSQHQSNHHPPDLHPAAPLGPPPPPPPQCPPPPPPTSVTPTTPTTPSESIKPENIPEDDVAGPWQSISGPPTSSAQPSTSIAPVAQHCILPTVTESDPSAIFMPPQAPFSHRPRISVSSTSSGSSGHASIWSTNSAQSSMSWQSGSTCPTRTHPAMPMAPTGMNAPNGAPFLPGAAVAAANKTNIYWCTSCETSFKRKYDWKRHEDEFHERWRKYPCPEPGCNRSFWGSNSFNQHHKQCHGCKTCPHAEKVVKYLRKRKYWACGFCSALHPARERHVEHVARHFESGLTKGDWMHSRVVYGLLHQPLIREAWDAFVTSKQSEYAGRRPQFSWHPSKTGRAQGFLEKENAGQLQDLLEFFSGDENEAQWIVSVAYDLADIVLTSVPINSAQFADANMTMPTAFPGQDPRMSFMTLPSQAQSHPPQMMTQTSSDPNSPNAFATPFRGTMFVPSQPFSPTQQQQQQSPTSSSNSPMAASHSPLTATQSPLDKRELPPPPTNSSSEAVPGVMDFEYSPAPIIFDDWESLNSTMVDDGSTHSTTQGSQHGWDSMQYFGIPRVPSS